MKAKDILNNLIPYQHLLNEIFQQESMYIKEKKSTANLTKSISIAYSFITMELRDSENDNLYCEITFELRNNAAPSSKIYCTDPTRVKEIEKIINKDSTIDKNTFAQSSSGSIYLNKTITEYLTIADEIAGQAYNCAAGDDYRPGMFSEIILEDFSIKLNQINHMNAKSLAHKEDYSLRRLEFIIPIQEPILNRPYCDYKIGDMLIYFSDSSSKNNKACGNAIIEKIKNSIASFNKK